MIPVNLSEVSEFRLLGFSEVFHLHPLLCVVLFSLYIFTLMANTVIALIINGDDTLHTPMYFFLMQLSCLDICYLSVIVPKILENLMVGTIGISKTGCAMQMFFFLFFGVAESFLLAAMSFDRYVAICYPLHYTMIMNSSVCKSLVAGTYMCGTAAALLQTITTFSLPFCGLIINHFFCEIQHLLELFCDNTSRIEIQVNVLAVFAIVGPFLVIIYSYIHIISTILKISSAEGQEKAFSTCSSHILVVTLFYGTASSMYLRPKSAYSASVDKFLSLSHTVVTPLLNPIIYSWRNEEVKGAVRKRWRKINLVCKCNRIFPFFQVDLVVSFTVNSCSGK